MEKYPTNCIEIYSMEYPIVNGRKMFPMNFHQIGRWSMKELERIILEKSELQSFTIAKRNSGV